MTNNTIIGVVLGAAVCAGVVVGNMLRGDPHLVSVFPNLVSVAVAPLAVYALGRRRRRRGVSSEGVQTFGVRVGAVAGAVFAVGLAVFTVYWLPASWALLAFGGGVAFGTVFVLSCFAGYAAGQSRITAV